MASAAPPHLPTRRSTPAGRRRLPRAAPPRTAPPPRAASHRAAARSPAVPPPTTRRTISRCDVPLRGSARVFAQDWGGAIRVGFGIQPAKQFTYRYKIYVRGSSWSVSKKYILAYNSPVLLLDTPVKNFFSRGLVAGKHYWPIDPSRKCAAIKFAVDWGNAHPAEARRMALEGSGFTFLELCPEAVACTFPEHGSREREFLMESREKASAPDSTSWWWAAPWPCSTAAATLGTAAFHVSAAAAAALPCSWRSSGAKRFGASRQREGGER